MIFPGSDGLLGVRRSQSSQAIESREVVADAEGDKTAISDLETGTDFATGERGKAGSGVSGVAQSCCAIRGDNRKEERSLGPAEIADQIGMHLKPVPRTIYDQRRQFLITFPIADLPGLIKKLVFVL